MVGIDAMDGWGVSGMIRPIELLSFLVLSLCLFVFISFNAVF